MKRYVISVFPNVPASFRGGVKAVQVAVIEAASREKALLKFRESYSVQRYRSCFGRKQSRKTGALLPARWKIFCSGFLNR